MNHQWLVAGAALLLSGCSGMNMKSLGNDGPRFDFNAFFEGETRASGWFSDRFGKPRRHFCGDFIGTRTSDGGLELDETLYYTDGVVETRVWRVAPIEAGRFRAESEALVGTARGEQSGNTLLMDYTMRVLIEPGKEWPLTMQDVMQLQPDQSLHNTTQVYKWGVRLGSVSTQYTRHDGSGTCGNLGGSLPAAATDG